MVAGTPRTDVNVDVEETVDTTPAVLRGSLIVRTVSSLWRIAQTD